jgi:hypothetical protein
MMDVLALFPLDVGAACVGRDGIYAEKIKDRTGKLEPRRFPPSDAEIRVWCNERVADLHSIVNAGEKAAQVGVAQLPTASHVKTAAAKAYVEGRLREFRELQRNSAGQREEAERILRECGSQDWRKRLEEF